MTLGDVDITTVMSCVTVYVLIILFFKKWTTDYNDREVLVFHARNEVKQPLIRFRTRFRPGRSTRFRPNRRRSHLESTSINFEAELVQSTTTSIDFEAELVQSTTTSIDFEAELVQSTTTSIDFEAELDKPYGKALKEFYSDEQIKQALIYMNQKGTFTNEMKTSTIVEKNIEHIKNVDEWARTFSIDTDPETNFPKELPKPDLVNRLLQFKEWDHAEINLVLDETFKVYGFYPLPTEFCEIYERKKDMLEQNQRKLREENDKLKQENLFLKQKCISQDELEKMIGELQKQNSYLQKRQSCKICSENELEIMLIPCRHVYCCKECFNKQRRKWCNICNQNVQRVDSFHLP